ncbi:MAG: amidohydrolase [Dehalococcoidia bacterium]|nr:amidohydrolase [Dehalococcoidia bacterium]
MLAIGNDTIIDFPIVDADAHVNEPPDLWQKRVPAKLRERAPKVIQFERGGDAWSFDGGKSIRPVGLTATAGLSYLQFKSFGISYETMRPGSFDPKARIQDLDLDGIYCQLIYPSVTLAGAKTYSDDPELQVACVRAYNEWLAEFCSYNPDRMYGLGIIPTVGVEAAVKELERCIDLGMRGAIISRFPNGGFDPSEEDAPFWDLCQSADFPVHIHIGSFFRDEGMSGGVPLTGRRFMGAAGSTKSGGMTFPVVEDIIFSGILDDFPALKVVLVEANIGWIPTLLEQTDDMFLRYRFWTGGADMKMLPSEYFYRNMYSTFMIDTVGMALRYRCGIGHAMWSTDYPHTGSDWPNSRVTLDRNFRGVPYNEIKMMARDNAVKLYKLNVPEKEGLPEIPARRK